MNRLEKVETLNSEIAKGLHRLDDFDDELRLSSDILNNMKNLVDAIPISNPKIEEVKNKINLYNEEIKRKK